MAIFTLCVGAAVALVPWDHADRVAVGSGAGAVLASVVLAWFSSRTGARSGTDSTAESGDRPGSGSGRRSGRAGTLFGRGGVSVDVNGENSGAIVIGDGNTVRQ